VRGYYVNTDSTDPLEFLYDFYMFVSFSILYATTPDDGFELAETRNMS
jgi:hypothetical protein